MPRNFKTTIKLNKNSRSNTTPAARERLSKNKPANFGSWRDGGTGGRRGANGSTKTTIRTRLFGTPGSSRRKRFAKIMYSIGAVFAVFLLVGTLGALAWVQQLTKELPDPSAPFDNANLQSASSVIYDRNGTELWRLFDKRNTNVITMDEGQELTDVVPNQLKWAIIAGEDIDYYSHPGINVGAILRCSLRLFRTCGGSTITQQVAKNGAFTSERSVERKASEIILAMLMNNQYTKDEVLLFYMNIINAGSNVYGVDLAAKTYFGKSLNELTLAEAAVIGAQTQLPTLTSPLVTSDRRALNIRKEYVLNQMYENRDRINAEVRKDNERKAAREGRELTDEEKEDFITAEKIEAAKTEEITYLAYEANILAPHFVFFAQNLLVERPYNNGEVFDLQELNRGGYKIYTTLDYDMQKVALDVVQNVAMGPSYAGRYGNQNASMMTIKPKTGEILTMVGSRCYNNFELANCTELDGPPNDRFDSKVNILTTQQQPGSSIKPMVYYEAYRQGKLSPGSQLADIPIEIGNYKPKNSDPNFIGINSARHMLSVSRNIPAISSLMSFGPERLAELNASLGYSVNVDPARYGPSAALGAQDVLPVDHASAFGVFANGGDYVPYEAILRIEDRNGNVIFDLNGDNRPIPQRVADERAVFLINDSTNPKSIADSPVPRNFRDGRDVAGKTGTSENNRDNWFVLYSPDFVTLGWAGNNNNDRMAAGAFGSTNAAPWVTEFMNRVKDRDYFNARTAFNRPGGIARGQICGDIEFNGEKRRVCEGGEDYYIDELAPPVYLSRQIVEVCVDQQDRLARDIDRATGNAIEKEFSYMRMPAASLQPYLDSWLQNVQGGNGAPTEICNVNRSANGENPWAIINSPQAGQEYAGSINANISGFTPSGTVTKMEITLANTTNTVETANFVGVITIPSEVISGEYDFIVKVFDSGGRTGNSSVRIRINGAASGLQINSPSSGATYAPGQVINVNAKHNPSPFITNLRLCWKSLTGNANCSTQMTGSASDLNASWTAPTTPGVYELFVRAVSINSESPRITVTVI